MKAEDTVMTEKELEAYWRNPDECDDVGIAEEQAEISFRVGINEVVEWIKQQDFKVSTVKSLLGSPLWQSKLKEWGVENA